MSCLGSRALRRGWRASAFCKPGPLLKALLKGPDFFRFFVFLLRTALKDCPQGPFSTGPTWAMFVPPVWGPPENAWVTQQYRSLLAPREGRGDAAISDFVPLRLGPSEKAGVM